MRRTSLFTLAAILAATGCTEDPEYINPTEAIEVGAPNSGITEATTMVTLPIRLEEEDEATERAELATELGVDMIPYVRREDLELSLEWTIRNLSNTDGTARIHVNGATEYFAYVPELFVVDPEEEAAAAAAGRRHSDRHPGPDHHQRGLPRGPDRRGGDRHRADHPRPSSTRSPRCSRFTRRCRRFRSSQPAASSCRSICRLT